MANLFLVHSTKKKNIIANSKNLENKIYLQRQNILTEKPVGVTLPESLFPDDIILSQASNVDDFFSMSDKLSFSSRNLIECPASKPSFFSSCSIMLSNWRISAICKNYTIQYMYVLLPKMIADVCTQSSILIKSNYWQWNPVVHVEKKNTTWLKNQEFKMSALKLLNSTANKKEMTCGIWKGN